MCSTVQKMPDVNTMVKHVNLVHVYKSNRKIAQWNAKKKNILLEWPQVISTLSLKDILKNKTLTKAMVKDFFECKFTFKNEQRKNTS